ncbi:TRAP transporter small permease [Bacillus sp. OG2]|uniref:TRAP transporter small permease n=1 Tax=Bacillus infantis TaxID=324767 RepID=UPI000B9B962F|nr:TRAP transporter permease DctQ [Bacillus sp. OG2]
MAQFLKKMSGKVDKASRAILIAFFVLAFIATVYQVFSRFVLQSTFIGKLLPMVDFSIFNLTWIEELIRYLFVWIVFLGIGIVYKSKGHAQVEILHHYLSESYKKILSITIEIINSGLFLFMIVYGTRILKFTNQQISPSMGLNMTFIYGAVMVSALICLVHSGTRLAGLISEKTVQNSRKLEADAVSENTNIV